MTTSLEAMKAAREALGKWESSGKLLPEGRLWETLLGITHDALTLLDAAIQREEGGCAGADGCHPGCRASACSCPCHAAEITPTRGVVSREGDWTTDEEWINGFVGDLAHDDGLSERCAAYMRRELAGRFREVRSLSAPSEPMVPRAGVMEAARESYSAALQGVAWGDSERCAARILDGGGHE